MKTVTLLLLLAFIFGQKAIPQADVLMSFDNENILGNCRIDGILAAKNIHRDGAIRQGNRPNLQLTLEATSKENRVVSLTYYPNEQPSLMLYKALRFWIWLPSEKDAKESFVDKVSLSLNKKSEFGSGDYELNVQYLRPGWNRVRYDFGSNMNALVDLQFFNISITMNQYFKQGDIYIDQVELEKMDATEETDEVKLESILTDKSTFQSRPFQVRKNGEPSPATTRDRSWSLRYQAIVKLQALHRASVVPSLLDACTSEVVLVRNRAKEAVVAMGKLAIPALTAELNDSSGWMRQLVVEIITTMGLEHCGPEIIPTLQTCLLDSNYYVRDAAIKALKTFGMTDAAIVAAIVPSLNTSISLPTRIVAAQILSEMSVLPGLYDAAKASVPNLLSIVQNPKEDLLLRLHALATVWKLKEEAVPLSAWLLPLQANPAAGHRHSYNKAMAALENAGITAVPLLREALKTSDPTVKTRVATILMAMGPKAKDASPELYQCLNDSHWYVRWQAMKALESMGITSKEVQKVTGQRTDVHPPVSTSGFRVSVISEGAGVTRLDNGILEMTFSERSHEDGPVSLRKKGDSRNLIMGFGYFHWLCNRPMGASSRFNITSTDDYADVSIFHPSDEKAVVDFDVHYILRKGESGFYTYITVRKKPEKPDMLISFFDFLVRTRKGIFSTVVLHDKFQGPSFSDYTFSEDENKQMKDIFQATYRLPNGEVNAKHEWQNHEYVSNVSGAYGKNIGIWAIHPSWEYFGAAFPNCIRMMDAGAFLISSLDNKYYFRGGCVVTGDFEKIYGPFYTYLNTGENGTEMWTDAKRQAEVEMKQWPYRWMDIPGYHERSTVTGKLTLTDGSSPDSSWIILSHPDSTYGWQRDTGPYMFWVRTRTDGSFEIPNVRSGRYTLFANKEGVWGEFRKDGIDILPNRKVDLGNLSWTPSNHGKLLWQIGIPNRNSKEFRNGSNFGQWDSYLTYRACFPADVDYVVGKSDYRKDWNYVQPALSIPVDNKATPWKIHFNLDKIPQGKLLLTIAISSTRQTFLNVLVNDQKIVQYNYPYGKDDDSAGIRTAAYGLYTSHSIILDKDLLRTGENCITLVQTYLGVWSNVMYDCVKLEEVP